MTSTRYPPNGTPRIVARLPTCELMALVVVNWFVGTRFGMIASRQGAKTAANVPSMNAVIQAVWMLYQVRRIFGMAKANAHRMSVDWSIVRFHGNRSTSVNANGPNTTAGMMPQKVMSAMCLVVFVECVI